MLGDILHQLRSQGHPFPIDMVEVGASDRSYMLPSSFRCCAVFEWPGCLCRLSGARVRPRAGLLQDWTESFMIYEEARRHLVSSVLVWLTALSVLLVAAYIAAAKARNVAKYACAAPALQECSTVERCGRW